MGFSLQYFFSPRAAERPILPLQLPLGVTATTTTTATTTHFLKKKKERKKKN